MAAADLVAAGPARLETEDGVLLSTWVHRAPGDAVATVVLVHGFTASKDDPTVVALAGALAATGFDVVAYDGRGHGASGGVCTLGDDERHDVARAVRHARAFGRPVVAVGASMGAIAVLRYAVDDPDLAGVVTVSCPARWRLHGPRSVLSALMTRTAVGRWFVQRQVGVRLAETWTGASPPERLVERVTCPIAVVHGRADRWIPFGEAERIHARAPRARLDLVSGMGHGFDASGVDAVVEATRWTLSQGPPVDTTTPAPPAGPCGPPSPR
jgi:pimeloyl-ACP methyl ester carboxylesterase